MIFITFEGPEGAGKSTQIRRLAEAIERTGKSVCLTREPGGAPEAEALRSLLLDPKNTWSSEAEALLMYAARDAHLRTTILPALAKGEVVLCDRFFDSTEAYQWAVDPSLIATLRRGVVSRAPDLTLLIDVPVEEGMKRASARGALDRFEMKGHDYHEAVRQRFLSIAEREPGRVAVIDGRSDTESVFTSIAKVVNERLPDLLG